MRYQTYRRRWLGVLTISLINVTTSWGWITFAANSQQTAEYFGLASEVPVNWLSNAILLTYVVFAPVSAWVLKRYGVRMSLTIACIALMVGVWVRVIGARADGGNFRTVVFGQLLIGVAQPFGLNAPAYYSDLWFTSESRVAVTAIGSLSNPLGAALGQLINPLFVTSGADIPSMLLYVAIMLTALAAPSLFTPAQPPTPPCPSAQDSKLSWRDSGRQLRQNLDFQVLLCLFAVYVGFFNGFTTLLNQFLQPYGFSSTQSGIAGGILIIAGLISAAIICPIIDRTKTYLLAVIAQVPLIAACYVALVFAPESEPNVAIVFVMCGLLGMSSFPLVSVALELVVERTHPMSPALSSSIFWAAAQLWGVIVIVVMGALKNEPSDGNPPGNAKRALVFEAVLAVAVAPIAWILVYRRKATNQRIAKDLLDTIEPVEPDQSSPGVSIDDPLLAHAVER